MSAPEIPEREPTHAALPKTIAVLAASSGLVFAASTPPIDFQLGILVGLMAFAAALFTHAGPRRSGAWRGFLFGLTANLLALRFVPEVIQRFTEVPAIAGWAALALLSAAQALPWMLGGALTHWLMHPREGAVRPPAPPWLAFAAGVYAATFAPAVFPWTPAGGLARWPILLQSAELVGERGTSFLMATACGLAAEGLLRAARSRADRRTSARLFALSAAMFALLTGFGALRMRAVDAMREAAPRAKIALLEPDFDATFRWDPTRATRMMKRLSALTKRAETDGAELTVWPESAYPYTLVHGTPRSPLGERAILQQGVRGPVLTGAYLSKGAGLGTNAAILVTADGSIGPPYDKRHLLWFGETVPFAETFPFLRRVFARGTGLEPGSESVVFRTGEIALSVLNCYEDTLPAAGREAMSGRPNLLVNITNDAWFAGSAEGELHLRLSVLRAVETRRDLLRAVNRGPTTWVDAAGRVVARREAAPGLGAPLVLLADAALLGAPLTLYARAGDIPLVALVAIALALPWIRARRRRR